MLKKNQKKSTRTESFAYVKIAKSTSKVPTSHGEQQKIMKEFEIGTPADQFSNDHSCR